MRLNSIGTRTMLILVAVSILIVLTLGGLWLHTTRQLLEDNIYSSDRSDSRQLAEYIRTYLDDITNNLNIISTNPDTINAIRSNDSIRLQQIIENLNMSSPHIDAVAIIDNSGRILRGTRVSQVLNIDLYPWYAEMTQYKTPYITGIYHSYSANEYAFAILTPIQDNNMIYGRIMAVITPDTLHDNIKAHYYNSHDNIMVVDSNGRVISSEDLTKMTENTDLSAYSPVRQVIRGASGVIEHSDTWDGQQRISAFQPVPGSNWGVIVSTPLSIEYKQLNDLIRWILGILLASIVAVSLLGYLLSRLITGPIVRLSETMKQIAHGNYHLRAKTRRRDEIGDLAGTFNTMMDSLEDERSQSEMYLDLMGHDINNMNQVALGYLQLAEEKIKSGEPLRDDSNVLITKPIGALEDSSMLIDNIRKLQRARAGEMPRVTVDVSAVMKELKEKYSHVPGRDVRIVFSGPDKCEVIANDLIKDMFSNLIGNSIKHSDPEKPLLINLIINEKIAGGKKLYEVAVEDDGPGIPDEIKEKLFTRFSRGKTKAKGSGLGLYLVKAMAESYGGTVRVEDRIMGDHTKGARFVVTIPSA